MTLSKEEQVQELAKANSPFEFEDAHHPRASGFDMEVWLEAVAHMEGVIDRLHEDGFEISRKDKDDE